MCTEGIGDTEIADALAVARNRMEEAALLREEGGYLGLVNHLYALTMKARDKSDSVMSCQIVWSYYLSRRLEVSTPVEKVRNVAGENVTPGGGDEPLVRRLLLCSCSLSLGG